MCYYSTKHAVFGTILQVSRVLGRTMGEAPFVGMAWRNVAAMRGHHTNNYAEISVRLFKDHVLMRCKAYNAVALVDFIVTVMDPFYCNRLERFANGRVMVQHLLLDKLMTASSYLTDKDNITLLAAEHGNCYLVPSEKDAGVRYEVDATVGLCSCPYGRDGRLCKHQTAVYRLFNEALPNLPAVTAEDRYNAACLALGDKVPPASFYDEYRTLESDISTTPQVTVNATASAFTERCVDAVETTPCDSGSIAEHTEQPAVAAWRELSRSIENKIAMHPADGLLIEQEVKRMAQQFSKVYSVSQLASFLSSFKSKAPPRNYSNSGIKVQPTSVAHRKQPHLTHGAKRQLSGRPATNEPRPAKRPRNLGHSINRNVPTAKSHGAGH